MWSKEGRRGQLLPCVIDILQKFSEIAEQEVKFDENIT